MARNLHSNYRVNMNRAIRDSQKPEYVIRIRSFQDRWYASSYREAQRIARELQEKMDSQYGKGFYPVEIINVARQGMSVSAAEKWLKGERKYPSLTKGEMACIVRGVPSEAGSHVLRRIYTPHEIQRAAQKALKGRMRDRGELPYEGRDDVVRQALDKRVRGSGIMAHRHAKKATKPKKKKQAKVVTINRDPFGRFDIIREAVGPGRCDWCGQKKKTLYQYGINYDDRNRDEWTRGSFCCKSCWQSYHL